MYNGRFQIFLRRRQNTYDFDQSGNNVNVIVQCNPLTGFAEYVPGNVDNAWKDFTNYIEDAEKISFTWDKVNSGNSLNSTTNQFGSNYDKGISADLLFFDRAFEFIYSWLLDNECQILNAIEVKIVDLIAGSTYRLFEIKNDNLEYAPIDDPCQFRVKLREQDNVWHCIHKTFIWDNWQHWFEDSSVKEHPCFLTCIEPRPRLINSARMGFLLFWHAVLALPSAGLVSALLNLLFGQNIIKEARKILNTNRFVDAPLIRTYIENVAGKCGLTYDTIFDVGQDWENLCLYFPQAGYMHESEEDDVASPSLAYHFDNRWLITIAELFDKLKVVFAAEWYVTPLNKIVFKYTKDLINLLPIYDFTAANAELAYNIRYTFNGDKKPAYGRYQYQDDGSDLASQEMSTLYSDIIDYDGPAFNPMLEGEKSKNFEFAPTGFVRDGRAKDYLRLLIEDGKTVAILLTAIIAIIVISLIGGGLTIIAAGLLVGLTIATMLIVTTLANSLKDEFVNSPTYRGAVRLTSEQVLTPRLILWDGVTEQRAKVESTVTLPTPNTYYNPNSTPYNVKNRIEQDNPDNVVYNYPLYFDGDFEGNLFDRFHDVIDNPLKSKESHQEAKFSVDLCEGMQHLFGVFENEYAQIGKIIKLEHRNNYDVFVRIGNINIDNGDNKIDIRGSVIRRVNVDEDTVMCDTFQINTRCLIINGFYININ